MRSRAVGPTFTRSHLDGSRNRDAMQTIDGRMQTDATDSAKLMAGTFDWDAALVGMVWRHSKDGGGALIIHPTVCAPDYRGGAIVPVPPHMTAEGWHAFRLDGQRKENARRDRATLEVCALVLMAYVEGRHNYATKIGNALGDFLVASLVADHSAPSYHEMKGFIEGELDAHPVVAAAAAFSAMRYCNRERLKEVYGGWHGVDASQWRGEKGWI